MIGFAFQKLFKGFDKRNKSLHKNKVYTRARSRITASACHQSRIKGKCLVLSKVMHLCTDSSSGLYSVVELSICCVCHRAWFCLEICTYWDYSQSVMSSSGVRRPGQSCVGATVFLITVPNITITRLHRCVRLWRDEPPGEPQSFLMSGQVSTTRTLSRLSLLTAPELHLMDTNCCVSAGYRGIWWIKPFALFSQPFCSLVVRQAENI